MGVDSNISAYPNFDKLELVKTGILTATAASETDSTTTTAHNLGYTPIILAFVSYNTVHRPLPTWIALNIDTANDRVNFQTWIDCSVDDTNIYTYIANSLANTLSHDIRYYLLRVRSNTS